MGLLRAFERNVARGPQMVRRTTPEYKLLASEALATVREQAAKASVRVNPLEIKRLLADSEASLVRDEIAHLRQSVANLEKMLLEAQQKFDEYRKVTERLAEEMRQMSLIRSLKSRTPRGRYYRDARSVSVRWAEWGKLFSDGMSCAEIAARYGMDVASVRYAQARGWECAKKRQELNDERIVNDMLRCTGVANA